MKKIIMAMFCTGFLFGCNSQNGETISATGTIEATDVTLSAQAGGQVKRIIADEGDAVQAGDTLLLIDNIDWLYQLEQMRGGYEMAEAQYHLALKGAREEDVIQAEANYKNAEDDLQRMKDLYRGKSVSEKQVDDAQTRFTVCSASTARSSKCTNGVPSKKSQRLCDDCTDIRNSDETVCGTGRTSRHRDGALSRFGSFLDGYHYLCIGI
jgi:HlyD family secretion protein